MTFVQNVSLQDLKRSVYFISLRVKLNNSLRNEYYFKKNSFSQYKRQRRVFFHKSMFIDKEKLKMEKTRKKGK